MEIILGLVVVLGLGLFLVSRKKKQPLIIESVKVPYKVETPAKEEVASVVEVKVEEPAAVSVVETVEVSAPAEKPAKAKKPRAAKAEKPAAKKTAAKKTAAKATKKSKNA